MTMPVWRAYHITLKLLTPMHIGWRKVGNLQQTRTYVPARTLWGALTARLVRDSGYKATQPDYDNIGNTLDNDLRFSYLYPVDNPGRRLNFSSNQDWPWTKTQGLFAWKYLSSYAGSPLTEAMVAESGGLHETEFIMPFTRDGKEVFLQGYIFEKIPSDDKIKNWPQALSVIQLGGERSYGWGRVTVTECKADPETCFGTSMILDNSEGPMIRISPKTQDNCIFAHTEIDYSTTIIRGKTELFTGRQTKDGSKFGRSFFDKPVHYWVPGSRITEEGQFIIERKGLWKKVSIAGC